MHNQALLYETRFCHRANTAVKAQQMLNPRSKTQSSISAFPWADPACMEIQHGQLRYLWCYIAPEMSNNLWLAFPYRLFKKKISHLWPCIHLNQLPLACVPCNPTWPLSSPATELKITCEVKSTIKYCEDGPSYIKIVQAPRRGAITERGAHTASSALEKNGGYAHNEAAAWGRANTILSNAVIEAPFPVVWTGSNAA